MKVFSYALKLLIEGHIKDHEDKTNRKLYFKIHAARRILQKSDSLFLLNSPLTYQAQNQPDFDDKTRAGREDKKPDFIWSIYDDAEPIPENSAKHYCIECKRLGIRHSGWVFNVNYIENGVRRFVDKGYGYGQSARVGLMVGYVESEDIDTILAEVNAAAVAIALSPLLLSGDKWQNQAVNRLNQTLMRPNVLPSTFDLRHLWVDLRGSNAL